MDYNTDIMEVIRARHSVRQYTGREIEREKRIILNTVARQCSIAGNLDFEIFYDEPRCFSGPIAKYGRFENVSNYIVISGNGPAAQEKAGYYGQRLVLEAQRIGLNTCWVALTHGKTAGTVKRGNKILIIISVGYGASQGNERKTKPMKQLCETNGEIPEWFERGMEAAMLAPTAMNQQKFKISLLDNKLTAKAGLGMYAKMDLGIVKYNFEVASGHRFD